MKRALILIAVFLLAVPGEVWAPPSGGVGGIPVRSFRNIAAGGNTVSADTHYDNLTLSAGTGISIASSPTADSITITGTGADHGALTGLGDDDHPQYLTTAEGDAAYANTLYTGGTGITISSFSVSTNDGQIDHDSLSNTHNLTTSIDHNTITNNHNLTTAIDHNTITNNHNLTTDINHDNLTGFVGTEHLDWTTNTGQTIDENNYTVQLNDLANPGGDTSLTMGNSTVTFTYTAPTTNAFELEISGGFSGDGLHVHQHTGNPGATNLVVIEAEDPDVTPLRLISEGTLPALVSSGDVSLLADVSMSAICATDDNLLRWNTGGDIDCVTQAGGGDMSKSTYDTDTDNLIDLAAGGLEADMSDPNDHRVVGWDDSANAIVYMDIGSGLAYNFTTDTLSSTGGLGADSVDDTHIDWGGTGNQVDMDDLADGATNAAITLTQETNFETAYTHANGSTGADHTYISQDVTTTGNPQFATIELGHANDTTLSRVSAGDMQIQTNIVYRAGGTDVALADGGTGAGTAAGARAALEAPPPSDHATITGDNLTADTYPLGKAQVAYTITDIHCITDTGTVTLQLEEGTSTAFSGGAGVDGATTIVCDSNGQEDDGSLSNGTIDANDWLAVQITGTASSPTVLGITWFYTVD